jgi:hypothetical protein
MQLCFNSFHAVYIWDKFRWVFHSYWLLYDAPVPDVILTLPIHAHSCTLWWSKSGTGMIRVRPCNPTWQSELFARTHSYHMRLHRCYPLFNIRYYRMLYIQSAFAAHALFRLSLKSLLVLTFQCYRSDFEYHENDLNT